MSLRSLTFGDVYRRNAERYPDRSAFIFEGKRVTHADYLRRVERLAGGLAIGVKAGDRIAILSQNCLEMVDLIGATALLGAILLPVNYRLSADEIGLSSPTERPSSSLPATAIMMRRHVEGIAALRTALFRHRGRACCADSFLGSLGGRWRSSASRSMPMQDS